MNPSKMTSIQQGRRDGKSGTKWKSKSGIRLDRWMISNGNTEKRWTTYLDNTDQPWMG